MLKTTKSSSKQLQADLDIAGHPNLFPSKPVSIKFEWDLLQSLDYRTLMSTHCHTGRPAAWQEGIAAIYEDVDDVPSLLFSLTHAQRTIHPTTDTRVLLMPSQALFRSILKDTPDISDATLIEEVRTFADRYVEYYMRGVTTNRLGQPYDLDCALGLYEMFHILESLNPRWSSEHLFKCNCCEFVKRASCCHCLLAGMACDSRIKVPSKYRAATVQQRRKRGRPSPKATELGDEGEAKARARIELQKQYIPPQVCSIAIAMLANDW